MTQLKLFFLQTPSQPLSIPSVYPNGTFRSGERVPRTRPRWCGPPLARLLLAATGDSTGNHPLSPRQVLPYPLTVGWNNSWPVSRRARLRRRGIEEEEESLRNRSEVY